MIRKIINSDFQVISEYYTEFNINNVDLFDLGPFANIYVYEKDKKVVGFINYSIIYDRAELSYIYVDKNYRNLNIASELMEFMIVDTIDNGCKNITLEVAANNEAGLKLYEKYNFSKQAIRKNYYNGCDGILMLKELNVDEK
mgnify:CR=1 FL=1